MLLNAELSRSLDEQPLADADQLSVLQTPEAFHVQTDLEALAAHVDALYTPADEAAIAARDTEMKHLGSGDGLGYVVIIRLYS